MTTADPAPRAGTADPSPRARGVAGADPWWVRPGLGILDGRLGIAGVDAESLARRHGTPLFVYDRRRVAESARDLQTALASAGLRHVVRFALKANREPEILEVLRGLGGPGSPESVGIDACSPGEVLHALAHGWRTDEISFTGTNVSERDLDVLLEHGVHVNLDSVSQVECYGRRAPGTRIGLRVWNVNNAYFVYCYAQELVLCRAAAAARSWTVTVAGHINEAGDVFAEDYPMMPVTEGDIVALLNGGGYHQAMSTTHCLRPLAGAIFLDRDA